MIDNYDIIDLLEIYDENSFKPEQGSNKESEEQKKDRDERDEREDRDSNFLKFKLLILKIYNTIHMDIFEYKNESLEVTLYNLNKHFRKTGLAYQKFNINILLDELFIYLKIQYIDNESEYQFSEIFFRVLGLTSPNVNMSEEEYWNINFDPVDEFIQLCV